LVSRTTVCHLVLLFKNILPAEIMAINYRNTLELQECLNLHAQVSWLFNV